MSESTTNDARFIAARGLAEKMLDAAIGATDHASVLEALMLAYVTVAKAHPCCTQAAANSAMRTSMRLAHYASERPAGTQVH